MWNSRQSVLGTVAVIVVILLSNLMIVQSVHPFHVHQHWSKRSAADVTNVFMAGLAFFSAASPARFQIPELVVLVSALALSEIVFSLRPALTEVPATRPPPNGR